MLGLDTVVHVEDLTVAYGEKPVLWDVDLHIPKGRMTAIVGPNGAGKSTLMKAILGVIDKTSGYVEIFGEEVDQVKGKIAYVPQSGSVDWDFPTTVLDVVMMGTYGKLGLFKKPGKRERDLALSALKKVRMEDFVNRQISQLSGGQQQRVFLARALVQEADIYFWDEPLKGVDLRTEHTIMEILNGLRDEGKNVLVVHHDLKTVPTYFDDVVLLNVRVYYEGPVEEVFTNENIRETFGTGKEEVYV